MMEKLRETVRLLARVSPFPRKLKGFENASAVDNVVHDKRNFRGGLYPFAAGREQVVADLRSVRMLEKAVSDECLRALQHGERASLREVTVSLVSAAKREGIFIPYSERTKFGDVKRRRSGESEIFIGTDFSQLVKFKDPDAKQPIKNTTPKDWLLEHIIHNVLFPETRYEFVGISEFTGSLRIVLRQRNVNAVSYATDESIAEELVGMGLVREDRYFFGNEVLSVTDVGAHGDNVLLGDDQHLYFIDPLVRLKRPAVDVLSWLVGDLDDN